MKKVKIFKQETLTIENKVISSKESFIQIRNITRVWHGKPEIEIPILKLVLGFFAGIFLQKSNYSFLAPFGFIITLIIVGVAAYYLYMFCHYTLNFELSSGEIYAFTSLDKSFLKTSYAKVKEIMNNKSEDTKSYKIDFSNSNINIIEGDNHGIIDSDGAIQNSGTIGSVTIDQSQHNKTNQTTENINSFNSNIEINYDLICDELNYLLSLPEIKEQKNDLKYIQAAKIAAQQKDSTTLKETLGKLSKTTLKIIENTASLVTIIEFINKVM